jgi:hypothetical protein
MDNVRLPIRTSREGNKITKVCVEDIYKMINRIGAAEERSAKEWNEIWESLDKDVEDVDGNVVNGCLVIGTGVSQPNIKDAFDETVGNNIAFMKAKLNANFKKRSLLISTYNKYIDVLNSIDEELEKIEALILMDLDNLREYNPEYLKDIEYKRHILEKDEETDNSDND